MAAGWRDHPAVRRWYVLVLGLALTVVAMAAVYRDAGVHWARAEVTLVAPAALGGITAELGPGASLIPVTTMLERVLADDMPFAFVSDAVPFYAVVDEGLSIRQLDTGGQWERRFTAPTLIIEVVSADAQRVEDVLASTISQVEATTREFQDTWQPRPTQLTTVTVDEIRRAHPVASRSGVAQAWLVLAGVGLSLSVVACRLVDRALSPARAAAHRADVPADVPAVVPGLAR